jgi:hypothetical protein
MNLDEAIKRLAIIEELMATDRSQVDADAARLGIEALKRWREYRARGMGWWMSPLPGETE